MLDISLEEAQLMRVLGTFFGSDRVIPKMSLLAVCGGKLPVLKAPLPGHNSAWGSRQKCLFTVVDRTDNPIMVFELFSGFGEVIDLKEISEHESIQPYLAAAGVQLFAIDKEELSLLLQLGENEEVEFFGFLEEKVKDLAVS